MNKCYVVQPIRLCSAIWSTWPMGFVRITYYGESPNQAGEAVFWFQCSSRFNRAREAQKEEAFHEERGRERWIWETDPKKLRSNPNRQKERKTASQKQTPKTEQHSETWLVAKWNKRHDAADCCILVTQSPKKKKQWMNKNHSQSSVSHHNRKDDSCEGYFPSGANLLPSTTTFGGPQVGLSEI